MSRHKSAERLRSLLAASDIARRFYFNEALYKIQVDTTCDLLDAVDMVADEATAGLVVAVIFDKLTGDGATKAEQRDREREERVAELMRTSLAPIVVPPDMARKRPRA
jgi:hypothetical protein